MKSYVVLFSLVVGGTLGACSLTESTPDFNAGTSGGTVIDGGADTNSGEDATTVCGPYDTTGFDFSTPIVKFSTDVFPFLSSTCAISQSCHLNKSPSQANGVSFGAQTPSAMVAGLNGVAAPELITMSLITKGDPTMSYLMHKLDGDQCVYDAMCTSGTCQERMPQTGRLVPVAQRDTIRRWIKQGALDN